MFRRRLDNAVIEAAHPVGQYRPVQTEDADCRGPRLVRRVAQSLGIIQGADQDLFCGVLLHIHSSAPRRKSSRHTAIDVLHRSADSQTLFGVFIWNFDSKFVL